MPTTQYFHSPLKILAMRFLPIFVTALVFAISIITLLLMGINNEICKAVSSDLFAIGTAILLPRSVLVMIRRRRHSRQRRGRRGSR